jgi:hypothetical protein
VNKATIKNLGMEDAEVHVSTTSGTAYAGGLMGYVRSGTVSNCRSTGAVTSASLHPVRIQRASVLPHR